MNEIKTINYEQVYIDKYNELKDRTLDEEFLFVEESNLVEMEAKQYFKKNNVLNRYSKLKNRKEGRISLDNHFLEELFEYYTYKVETYKNRWIGLIEEYIPELQNKHLEYIENGSSNSSAYGFQPEWLEEKSPKKLIEYLAERQVYRDFLDNKLEDKLISTTEADLAFSKLDLKTKAIFLKGVHDVDTSIHLNSTDLTKILYLMCDKILPKGSKYGRSDIYRYISASTRAQDKISNQAKKEKVEKILKLLKLYDFRSELIEEFESKIRDIDRLSKSN